MVLKSWDSKRNSCKARCICRFQSGPKRGARLWWPKLSCASPCRCWSGLESYRYLNLRYSKKFITFISVRNLAFDACFLAKISICFLINHSMMKNEDLQLFSKIDLAPGHMSKVICRIIRESGRMILWTPAGCSGYVQLCDDLTNATIQQGFNKVATDWMIAEIIRRHEQVLHIFMSHFHNLYLNSETLTKLWAFELHPQGEVTSGIPNPSLETMCQLVSKAVEHCTPARQAASFRRTGVSLPIDGSRDAEDMSFPLKDLLSEFGKSAVPTVANSHKLYRENPPPPEGTVRGILIIKDRFDKTLIIKLIIILFPIYDRYRLQVGWNWQDGKAKWL